MQEEERYIADTFKHFQYPNYFLYKAKRKAYKIHKKIQKSTESNNSNNPDKFTHLILSTNSITTTIKNNSSNLDIKYQHHF